MTTGTHAPAARWFAGATAMILLSGALIGASATRAPALTPCAEPSACPTAVGDSYTTSFNTKLVVVAPGLLANDFGPADTNVDVADSDMQSWNGADVAVHTNGSFTYTPDLANPFSGSDSFDYWIQDAQGNTDIATVTITVIPVLHDDAYYAHVNQALNVAAPGVFTNDAGIDPTSVTNDEVSAHGATVTVTVTVKDDGSMSYVPPAGFAGADSFTYSVYDLDFDYDYTATVHVQVDSAPPVVTMSAPTAVTLATKVPVAWSGTDASGVEHFDVLENFAPWNGMFGAWISWRSPTTTVASLALGAYGRTYCFRVRATDRAGNASAWVMRCRRDPAARARPELLCGMGAAVEQRVLRRLGEDHDDQGRAAHAHERAGEGSFPRRHQVRDVRLATSAMEQRGDDERQPVSPDCRASADHSGRRVRVGTRGHRHDHRYEPERQTGDRRGPRSASLLSRALRRSPPGAESAGPGQLHAFERRRRGHHDGRGDR